MNPADDVLAAFVALNGTRAKWAGRFDEKVWDFGLKQFRAGHADCAAQVAKDDPNKMPITQLQGLIGYYQAVLQLRVCGREKGESK